jgi:hypothetical protein
MFVPRHGPERIGTVTRLMELSSLWDLERVYVMLRGQSGGLM